MLAIPELMRLLVDENGVDWEQAWSITRRTFAYTCHTLLPEALETWPVPMFGRLLPRHLEIISALNRLFLADVRSRYPGDDERVARMSLIQEGPEHRVRMANLAVVGSFAVNGVAGLQSRLLAQTTLRDFAGLWPDRFLNVTNGVSPRRFLRLANPRLSALITARLGDDRWLTDLERLRELEAFADDAEFRAQWREAKRQNKIDLAFHILAATGVIIDPASLFDVMAKRLHEYKRQLLKLLHVVTVYNRIKADPAAAVTPCTVIFGAKAAPGYQQAKHIIKLINSVAAVVNADPDVAGRIKVVFIPDYNVSVSELVVAAGNVSEQISLAGKEASGTGNMKLALNGALTVGTLDGANIEIRDRVGADNFFLFGITADQAVAPGKAVTPPAPTTKATPNSRPPLTPSRQVPSGGDHDAVEQVLSSILNWDEYLVLADYRSYIGCHDRAVGPAWADQDRWTQVSILNTARSVFSPPTAPSATTAATSGTSNPYPYPRTRPATRFRSRIPNRRLCRGILHRDDFPRFVHTGTSISDGAPDGLDRVPAGVEPTLRVAGTGLAGPKPLAGGKPQAYEGLRTDSRPRAQETLPTRAPRSIQMKEKSSDTEDCDRDGRRPRHRRRGGYQAGLRRHGRGGPRPQRSRLHADCERDRERRRARARGRSRRQQDRSGERRGRAGGRRARRANGAGEQRRDNPRRPAVQDDRR